MGGGNRIMPVNGSGNFIGPSQPQRQGLVQWFDSRYVEPSIGGGTWDDISGEGGNITEYNAEDADWKGYYWDLDGTNEYFKKSGFSSLSTYTLEMWCDRDDTTGSEYYMDGRASDATDNWWFLSEYNSGDTNWWNDIKTNWINGYSNWHQVVVTSSSVDGSVLYINGEQTGTHVDHGTWDSAQYTIGSRYNGGSYWNGKVGIVRIYNRILSASDVMHNFLCDASKFGITIQGTS